MAEISYSKRAQQIQVRSNGNKRVARIVGRVQCKYANGADSEDEELMRAANNQPRVRFRYENLKNSRGQRMSGTDAQLRGLENTWTER